ncbi:hypothetical protein [Mycolicibacterium peregrinum]|uniref:hypothetical protein n=1 Tax=Mycolicibacterium peregrinum TaxID=43304 RepID=UPI003AAC5DC9
MNTITLAHIAIVITIIGVPAILGGVLYTCGIATKLYRHEENRAFFLGYEAATHDARNAAAEDTADTVES